MGEIIFRGMPRPHENLILSIFGPTAVGKSRVAAGVAAGLGGEVVSADSMQVYRGMAVLTDQPDRRLLRKVPHHLVAHVGLDEEYNAARYAREAAVVIEEIKDRGALPVLAGGTGLYVRSVLGGFDFPGKGSVSGRDQWRQLIEERGLEAAFAQLRALDPEAADSIDRNNPRRLVRALELAESGAADAGSPQRDRLWSGQSPYDVCSFGLELERQELYRRIDERVGLMLSGGAVDEVRRARRGRVSRTASQAIGFAVIGDYLDGKLSLDEAADAIRKSSRRYAKRQLTWMRKMPDIARIDLTGSSPEAAVEVIVERVRSRNG